MGRVVGVDPNPGMLVVARGAAAAEGAAIEWRQGRGEALPVDGADFDLVCCQQGLQYFQDRAAGLREMRRALAPGGRLVLSVGQGLERQPFRDALDEIVARHVGVPLFTPSVFRFGDAAELRALLEGAEFRGVVIEPLSLTARFPDPAAFVRFQVLALAAVMPAIAGMDAAAREATIAALLAEAQAAVRPYVEDGALVLPTHTHVAQALAA
jgi:SAM-dependent methyltransferase